MAAISFLSRPPLASKKLEAVAVEREMTSGHHNRPMAGGIARDARDRAHKHRRSRGHAKVFDLS